MSAEEPEDDLSHLRNVEKLAFQIIGQQDRAGSAADSQGAAADSSGLDGQGNKSVSGDSKTSKDVSKQKAKQTAAKGSVEECDASASKPKGSSSASPKDSKEDGVDSMTDQSPVDDYIGQAMSYLNALNSSQGPPLPTDTKSSGTRNESAGKPAPSPSVSSEASKTRNAVDKAKSASASDDTKAGSAATKLSCGKCSAQFASSSELSRHDCSGSSGAAQNASSRVITVKLLEKHKLECTECNFRAWGSAFEEHLMCHLMFNPYQCLYCTEAFRNRSEISRHVLLVHPTERMNCALKAMKTAKSLIEKAEANGSHTFPVEVKGKVPVVTVKKKQPSGVQKSPAAAAAAAAGSGTPSDVKKKPSDPPPRPSRDPSQESKSSTVAVPKSSSDSKPVSRAESSRKQDAVSKDGVTPPRKPDLASSISVSRSDSSSQEKVETSVTSKSMPTETVSAVSSCKVSSASVESASNHAATVQKTVPEEKKPDEDHRVGSHPEAKKTTPADDPDTKKPDRPGQSELSKGSEGGAHSDSSEPGIKPMVPSLPRTSQKKPAEAKVERPVIDSSAEQSAEHEEKVDSVDEVATVTDATPIVPEPMESSSSVSTKGSEKLAPAIAPESVDEAKDNVQKEDMDIVDEKDKDKTEEDKAEEAKTEEGKTEAEKAEEEEMEVSVEEADIRSAADSAAQSSTASEDVSKSKPSQSKEVLSKTTMEDTKDTVASPAKTADRMSSSQEGEEMMEADRDEAQEPVEGLGGHDELLDETTEKKEQHPVGATPPDAAPVSAEQSAKGITDSESPGLASVESKGVDPCGLTEVVGVPSDSVAPTRSGEALQTAPEEAEPTQSSDVASSEPTQVAPSALTKVEPDASTDTAPGALTETAPSASADSALDTSGASAEPSLGAPSDAAPSASAEETLSAPSAPEEAMPKASGEVAPSAPEEAIAKASGEVAPSAPEEAMPKASGEVVPSASVDLVPSAVMEASPSVLTEGVAHASPEVGGAPEEVPSSASTVVDPNVAVNVAHHAAEEVAPGVSEEGTPAVSEAVAPGPSEDVAPSTEEQVTTPSGSGEEISVVREDIAPEVSEKVNPDASETVTPCEPEKVSPDAAEKVTPGASETVTPGASETVTPGASETVTPGANEMVTPGANEMVIPGASEETAVEPSAKVASSPEDGGNAAAERVTAGSEGTEEPEAHPPSVSEVEMAASDSADHKEEVDAGASGVQEGSLDVEAQSAETAAVVKDDTVQEMDVDPSPEEPASQTLPVDDAEEPPHGECRSESQQDATPPDVQESAGNEVQSSLPVSPSTNSEKANIAEFSTNQEEKTGMEGTENAAVLDDAAEKSEESEGVGLKIIASFSLQSAGDGGADGGSQEASSAGLSHWEDIDQTGDKTDRADALSEQPTSDCQPTKAAEAEPLIDPETLDEPSPSAEAPCTASSATTSSTLPASQPPRLADPPPTVVPVMENFYVCGFGHCPFSSTLSGDFREHLLLSHIDEKLFNCYHCGNMVINDDSLLRHMSNHAATNFRKVPLYLCGGDRCRFGTNLLSDLLSHLETCHPDLTYFMCRECEDYFRSTQHLARHLEVNLLNVVSCPHCSAKGSQRKEILKHIARYHPGKAKMVSVGKQLLCRERKMNNYFPQPKPVEAPAPTHLMQHLAAPVATNGPEGSVASPSARQSDPTTLPDCFITSAHLVNVKKEKVDHGYDVALGISEGNQKSSSHQGATTQPSSTNGPQDFLCCQQCTFVAKDSKQMSNHTLCHVIPTSKKQRFVCMYCPQNFGDFESFKHHITSHPGAIQFHRYKCTQCSYDTNQRFMILHHIRKTNINHEVKANEGDMFTMIEETLPSAVLICDDCEFKTRSRINMEIHNRREHHADTTDQSSRASQQDVSHWAPQEIERQKLLALAHAGTPASGGNPETPSLRFKCPICNELFPKQSMLKEHIRMHSDVGVITLTMFTCKYCTTSSTAKDLISHHLKEKHPTKDSCLIKKLLSLDVRVLGPKAHAQPPAPAPAAPAPVTKQGQSTAPDEQPIWIIILPGTEDGKDTAYLCQICFKLYQGLDSFRDHCQQRHKNMLLMSRGTPDNRLFQLSTNFVDVSQDLEGTPGLRDEALVIPDKQVFSGSVPCPKCRKYLTFFRQNIMLHMQKQHPEMTIIPQNAIPRLHQGLILASAPAPPPPPPPPARQTRKSKGRGDLYSVGSALLDEKISPLYQKSDSAQSGSIFQCLLCNASHAKKYFMHVHIMQHLELQLCQCTHCDYSGFQKYKIVNHMKKFHPGRQVKIKFLEVDIDARVREFLPLIKKVPGSPQAAAASSAPPSPVVHLPEENQSIVESKKLESPGKDLSYSLGSDKLNESLACLYEMMENGRCRCLLCAADFQRRFAIHRHLLMHHLKVYLLKCHYCTFKGVEKNQIIDHILSKHKNEAIQADTLRVNFQERVTALLERHGSLSKYSLSPSERRAEKRQASSLLTLLTSSSSAGPSPSKLARGPGGSSFSPDSNNQRFLLGKEPLHSVLLPLVKEGPKGTLKCRHCSMTFPKRYSMHRHILMKHLKFPILKCSLCAFIGYERYQISTHISEHHSGENAMVTERNVDMKAAVEEFLNEQSKQQAVNTSKDESGTEDVKPDIDELNASITGGGESSEDTGHLVLSKFWQKKKPQPPSPTSPSSTSSRSRFPPAGRQKKQRRDVHTNIRVIHSGNKFFCGKCQFESVHRSNVQRHILRVHEGYTEKECKQCGYKTLSSVLMEEHMEEIHGEKRSSSEEASSAPESTSKGQDSPKMAMFACAYCRFETNDDKMIYQHTVENHEKEMESHAKEVALDELINSVSPSLKRGHDMDDECGLDPKFPKLDWLGTRTTTKPSFADREREENHCCPYCAFVSSSKTALRFHMRKHRCETKVAETETPKRKPFSSVMQTHTKDGRPLRFECTFCGIRTRQQTRIRYHYNRHVSYKPYKCSSCNSFFASPDQMRKHAKRMDHCPEFGYERDDAMEKKVSSLVEGGRLNVKKKKGPLKKGKKKPRPEASTSTPVAAAVVPPSPNLSCFEGEDDMEGEGEAQMPIFECMVCSAKRSCFQNLKRHHVKEHRKNKLLWRDAETGFVANMKGVVSRFTGPVWELSVKEEDMFEELQQEDRKSFNCKRCQFQSPMVQAIKSHLKSHMVKTFLCAYCSARYFHREMATSHQSKVHPGQTPWLVQFTETAEGVIKAEGPPSTWGLEALASEDSLTQPPPAATTPDSAQPPSSAPTSNGRVVFLCPQCSFSSTKLYNFRQHLAHHSSFTRLVPDLSGESSLKCGCCSYLAESATDFSNHVAKHLDDRTVQCAYCSYSAFLPSYVRRHQKSYHPDLPEAVETIKTSAVNVVMGKGMDSRDRPMVVDLDPIVLVEDVRHMSMGAMQAHLHTLASHNFTSMTHEDSSEDMGDANASQDGNDEDGKEDKGEEEEGNNASLNANVKEESMEVDEDPPHPDSTLDPSENAEKDAKAEEGAKVSSGEAEGKGHTPLKAPGTGSAVTEKVADEVDGPQVGDLADQAAQDSPSGNSGVKDAKDDLSADAEGGKNVFTNMSSWLSK